MTSTHVDVAIIGTGTAGMTAYQQARKHTDSILLLERDRYGTTCARVGCMPSKLLIAAADAAYHVAQAPVFGVQTAPPVINGRAVMQRLRKLRDDFVGGVVDTVEGWPAKHRRKARARFTAPDTLRLDDTGESVRFRAAVIATGSTPFIPDSLKAAGKRLYTTDTLFEWKSLPASVAVFGTGTIGLELGHALARLGVRVRLFGKGGGVGGLTDPALLPLAKAVFAKAMPCHWHAEQANPALEETESGIIVRFTDGNGQRQQETFEAVLAATGRRPALDDLGLETTGLVRNDTGVPVFDRYSMQCGTAPLFIAGDVASDHPVLHEAADEGRIAGANAARYPDVRCEMRRSPLSIAFTHPDIAVIGQSWRQLQQSGLAVATGSVDFTRQGRSRVMHAAEGALRVYAQHGTGRLLGAEMIAPRGEHLAHLLAWAHQRQMTIAEMLAMPFYHPVIEEGLRTALSETLKALRIGEAPAPRSMDNGPGI